MIVCTVKSHGDVCSKSWHSGAPDLNTDIEIDDDYARKVSGRFLSANQPIFRNFTRIYAYICVFCVAQRTQYDALALPLLLRLRNLMF